MFNIKVFFFVALLYDEALVLRVGGFKNNDKVTGFIVLRGEISVRSVINHCSDADHFVIAGKQ